MVQVILDSEAFGDRQRRRQGGLGVKTPPIGSDEKFVF